MGSSSVFLLKTNNLIGPRSIVRPYLYYNIKRYSKSEDGGGEKERAPSLAQEFRRVEEEKADADHVAEQQQQGLASQTVDKAYDGADQAVNGDRDVHSVKERFKEHEPGADYRRKN